MSKALDKARAKIAALDLNTKEGQETALAIAIAGREKANADMHSLRREAREWQALVRDLEPKIDRAARRGRAPYTILPSPNAKK